MNMLSIVNLVDSLRYKKLAKSSFQAILPLFPLFVFVCLSSQAFSQGFAYEGFDPSEGWRAITEDKDENIIAVGYFKPTPTSAFNHLSIYVYSKQGQLLNSTSVNFTNITSVRGVLASDSTYIVFFSQRNSNNTKSFRKSIHFTRNLSQYHIKTWGDTLRSGLIFKVKQAINKKDWMLVDLSLGGTNLNYSKADFYRVSNDFNQVLAYKQFRVEYDSTLNPILTDVIELPNKGYGFLFNGQMVDDTMYYSQLYSLLTVDSNMQETKRVLAQPFGTQVAGSRLGVLSQQTRGGLALESDSILLLYGCAYFYNYNPFLGNVCRTDSCVRQIRTRWSLPNLDAVGATVSNWTGKPAYHEGVDLKDGYRHLVWGSLDRDDVALTNQRDYQTSISLEEWNGGQRSLRRILNQTGYWLQPISVIKAKNGDYLIISKQNNFLLNANDYGKPLLARVDSAGQFILFTEQPVMQPLRVWPNPIQDRKLHIDLLDADSGVITLYDNLGRVCWQTKHAQQDGPLDVSAFPSGLYLLHVESKGNPPRVAKVMIP